MRKFLRKNILQKKISTMSDLGKLFKGFIIAVIVLTIFAYLGVYVISLVI